MTVLRLVLAGLALVLAAVPAAAQRDTPAPASRTGTIRGVVVAADTGAPIRDASVMLQPTARTVEGSSLWLSPGSPAPPRPAGARVDASGRFELRDVPPGRYRIALTPGPAAARYVGGLFPDPASSHPEPITVAPGQALDGLVLSVSPAAVVVGRVVSEQGDPVAGVMITPIELRSGGRQVAGRMRLGQFQTDDLGVFRVYGLSAGEYMFIAQPDPVFAVEASVARPGAPLGVRPAVPTRGYFPAATAGRDSPGLQLAAGQHYGPVEIVLGPSAVTIRGTALDPNGAPVSGVRVSLNEAAASLGPIRMSRAALSTADGRFEVRDVPPGEYLLEASRYSMNPDDSGQQQVVMALSVGADDLDGVTIALRRPGRITGRVTFEGVSPISAGAVRITAMPVRMGPSGPSPTTVEPTADRTFTIENQFGAVMIRAYTPPGWILKSVHAGGRDVTDEPIEPTREGPPVELVLTDSVASLSGTVTLANGGPIEASVVVFPEDPKSWGERFGWSKVVTSNSDGTYRATDLRPGRYYVVAVPGVETLNPAAAPRSYFELLARDAKAVTLNPSVAESVNLRLTRFD